MCVDPISGAAGLARDAVGATAGAALATGLTAYAAVRRDKPLHATGVVHHGTLTVTEPSATGVPLIDDPGSHAVRVRLSRATTDGSEGRDVFGIAIRIGGDAAPTDLLFASTGDSGVGRFALQVRRRIDDGPLTTMLPMTCASGSMILRLVPASDHEFALSRASARGSWHPVGLLTLKPAAGDTDEPIRFDALGNHPEGLTPPTWVRLLRAPAYAGARTAAPHAKADGPSRPARPRDRTTR
ncbi:hypothetical protein GCM10009810_36210 [Nostocoides vanveenii]|uniref:Phosphodiesterase n=1 Tax=Nostocoides vanveenii TaxID=330835 RepID=A0ABP4XB05_9MICO